MATAAGIASISSNSKITIRKATIADQSAIVALVIRNHLGLSENEDDGEYIRQVLDIPQDFAHLMDVSKFQKSHFFVAEQEQGEHEHQQQQQQRQQMQQSKKKGIIVGCAGMIPTNIKNPVTATNDKGNEKGGECDGDDSIKRSTIGNESDYSEVELTAVTVRPEFRRQGLGKTLIDRVLQEIRYQFVTSSSLPSIGRGGGGGDVDDRTNTTTVSTSSSSPSRDGVKISSVTSRLRVVLITLKERMAGACRLYKSFGFELIDEEIVHKDDPVMTVQRYALVLKI